MLTIAPFGWRELTPVGRIEYCFQDERILLRGTATTPPIDVSHSLTPMVWRLHCDDAWELRTKGAPSTVTKLDNVFRDLVRSVSDDMLVDERILLVQSACEAAYSHGEPCGKDLKSPRTEKGYPARAGEYDHGDAARDILDWQRSRGAHSSHGICQLLIGTAHDVAPKLFDGIPVGEYRNVLWRPENSDRALAALALRYAPELRNDPLVVRFIFGAGDVYSSSNKWGARLYDDSVALRWIAFWNDYSSLFTHT